MNSEKILDAMEFIDEDILESVDVLRKHPDGHRFLWLNYIAVAACLVFAVIGAVSLFDSPTAPETNNESQEIIDGNIGVEDFMTDDMHDSVTDGSNAGKEEFAGSTTDNYTDSGTSGNTTTNTLASVALYVEITEITSDGFNANVIESNGTGLYDNQPVTVIYNGPQELEISDFNVGDKVYLKYNFNYNNGSIIYTSSIAFNSEDLK